jgi:hypothetical protein
VSTAGIFLSSGRKLSLSPDIFTLSGEKSSVVVGVPAGMVGSSVSQDLFLFRGRELFTEGEALGDAAFGNVVFGDAIFGDAVF